MKKLFSAVLLVLASCAIVRSVALDSTWKGEVHPGVMSTLEFNSNGNLRWTFELPTGTDVYELEYEIDFDTEPHHVDITGFNKGPLAGQSLYGIAKWDDDILTVEALPGAPGNGGEDIRPTEFSAQARTFKRVR